MKTPNRTDYYQITIYGKPTGELLTYKAVRKRFEACKHCVKGIGYTTVLKRQAS